MLEIKEIPVEGYKRVIEAIDPKAKLHCFIAIHDTTLGPALGGTRMYPYSKTSDALDDVLRLAKGMTYKSALAECGLGGGKSVIIGDSHHDKTDALFHAFGKVVHHLNGEYIAAEDVGTEPADMLKMRHTTPYLSAMPTKKSSGDPSPFTCWGVFKGMQAVAQHLWHSPSLRGKRVLIQGLGHVGSKLADLLFWEGAELVLSDIDNAQMRTLAHRYGASTVSPKNVYDVDCDIFSPCALGAIINDKTLPKLKCKAIAGSANNELHRPEHGIVLMEKGILYAPDYVINAGGLINVSVEFDPTGYDPNIAREKVSKIYDITLNLFKKANREQKSTSEVADEMAEHNLKHKIGLRSEPIQFH
jgi:leucine dehydrogenase